MQRDVRASSRMSGAGCGGRVGLQRDSNRADEQSDAHGEVVWSWRPGAGAQRNALARCRDTGAIKPVPEESAYKPSNIAQGMPDDPAAPVVTAACFLFCRRAMGEAFTRHSLRPLVSRGCCRDKARARNASRVRRRMRNVASEE